MKVLKKFNMLNCSSTINLSETGLVLEKEETNEQVDETKYKKIAGTL